MKSSKALLIYAEEDIKKNEWFIGRLIESAAKKGTVLDTVTVSGAFDLFSCMDKEQEASRPLFVINRSRDRKISELFESAGVRSFNNSETIGIGNDKYAEYELFKELGIGAMETFRADFFLSAPSECIERLGEIFVLKSLAGHGGNEVFKVRGMEEVREIIAPSDPSGWLVQRLCDSPGKDVRIYMMGKKIVASVLRTSDTDFRSNFSLGGKVTLFEPDERMKETCVKISSRLGSDYIGIDFIKDKGRWVINEIEDAAGARMLYQLGITDIAECFMGYIFEMT